MSKIIYTKHAQEKFELLHRHGFVVSEEQVEAVIANPEATTPQGGGRTLAQRRVSDRHLLRVIYREEGAGKVVITFYPARRERYETDL